MQQLQIDSVQFRRVLSCYPTGICLVGGRSADDELVGMIIGSFTSVSLDPPLAACFPEKRSKSWPKIREGKQFSVNVFASDQHEACLAFWSKSEGKFDVVHHQISERRLPLLDHALAHLECALETEIDTGDHTTVLGRVSHLNVGSESKPSIFFKRGYHGLG